MVWRCSPLTDGPSSKRGARSVERPTTSAQLQRDSLCEGTTLFRDSVQNTKNPLALRAELAQRSRTHRLLPYPTWVFSTGATQKQAVHNLVVNRFIKQSERGDSNARPLRPERSALPTALHPDAKTSVASNLNNAFVDHFSCLNAVQSYCKILNNVQMLRKY